MLRWTLTIMLVLVVLSHALPWLGKFGLGRLPGDLRWRWFGRSFSLPLASTIVISLLCLLLARFFK
ncbi:MULTISPECIES: DUF2905 domain-containing protein [unclassified Undibacterium]|uniref:DUF2905 domain-containing protein n=1 Tax=unclassified Undibacterium TaxID=2630295 RepID=UPI002AC9D3F1|nr:MULTISPECIES: DUF2905 domain-containing protein [unclassified Undibacterium]MEB0137413.1 DUF2905 domain-containing protein [Undibacterium sp. CCC2.1]MEB0170922.1 DUF2905 domain-containing protein [Undibacterium sp. CCC1.1]MEB0174874.1 DUF2905 domain-containing protein [Undibacterium sp. CCC3.4]MEB0214210.1 DUF2905 domain-containing protein [Undibacterium sp. 5I2]WPX44521.1 DUF2905 domain-containing protein [Undibacterium sp. CCC3.4]